MIYKTTRRSLFKKATGIVVAFGARGILPGVIFGISKVATAQGQGFRDIFIRASVPQLSPDTSRGGASNLIIKAEHFRDNTTPTGLNAFEGDPRFGGHDHPIEITTATIAQLNAGQVFRGNTGQGTIGHDHQMEIRPNDYASERVLYAAPQSSNTATQEGTNNLQDSSTPLTNTDVFDITLSAGATPYLYVRSTVPLAADKITYKIATNSNESNPLPLDKLNIANQSVFKSTNVLSGLGTSVTQIFVYGQTASGQLVQSKFNVNLI